MAATLKQKLNLIDRMVTQQESMRQKQDDTQNQIDKLRLLLQLVVQRTKELQTEVKTLLSFLQCYMFSKNKFYNFFVHCISLQIEQDISKKYKNRTVYLTGGVNML